METAIFLAAGSATQAKARTDGQDVKGSESTRSKQGAGFIAKSWLCSSNDR
ncbi:MAG: hypothetical protein SWY16_04545 [Cyanobacteriota bacterium]|nr:hypothetical protein [Cyanobacteriota bacterium]